MRCNIADIIARPVAFNNRSLTIEGVCRTACENPFPHFTVEDKTGTIICKSSNGLPGIGAHIEVTGHFVIDVPINCTVAVPRLNEARREYIGNHEKCSLVGCEFEDAKPAFAA
jgi:hypothetical protein